MTSAASPGIVRDPEATARLRALVQDVFRPQPELAPDEQWDPQGTCDSTCEVLDEDGRIYDLFPGAELRMWGSGHPWESGHCWFETPDGLVLDPTIWQFTGLDADWHGAAYRLA